MSTRFQDDGRTIWDFIEDILVACPNCGGCAHVLPKDARAKKARPRWERKRRAGAERRQAITSLFIPAARRPTRSGPVDTFLGLPLYLQISCAGETLWALNARHLAWLEAFLSASLREDVAPTRHKTAVSALPQWLIVARHRDEALRAIARLRAKLLA